MTSPARYPEHPRIREVLEYIDVQRSGLLAAIESVPDDLRGRRPGPDRWSVAEIVEHLGLVEGGVARLFGRLAGIARERGVGGESDTGSILSRLDVDQLLDRDQREPAPGSLVPRGGLDTSAGLVVLERTRRTLGEAVLAMDGLAFGELKAPHPMLGELDGYQWLIFVGAHETRHAAQIHEARAALAAE